MKKRTKRHEISARADRVHDVRGCRLQPRIFEKVTLAEKLERDREDKEKAITKRERSRAAWKRLFPSL